MNCIIIDDEEMARAIISKMLASLEEINVVQEFSSAVQAMKFLNQNQVDLIFLDIHMDDFTGFDFIQSLKNPPKTILVTSDRNFAIDAFEYECIIDYVVKPTSRERLQKAVQKAKSTPDIKSSSTNSNTTAPVKTTTEDTLNEFYINIDRRLIKIAFDTVNFVEAKGDYIHIKTEAKTTLYILH